MTENYDATWLDYDQEVTLHYDQYVIGRKFGRSQYESVVRAAMTNTEEPGPYSWLATDPSPSPLKDLYETIRSGGISPTLKKEKLNMSYGDNYNDGRQKTSQDVIDEAVREAIEKPRREAEIAKRVALVSALETLKDVSVGTVITFTKNVGGKSACAFAGLKSEEDCWAVTGDGRYTTSTIYSYGDLLRYLTTGPNLAEDIQVATGFEPIAATVEA